MLLLDLCFCPLSIFLEVSFYVCMVSKCEGLVRNKSTQLLLHIHACAGPAAPVQVPACRVLRPAPCTPGATPSVCVLISAAAEEKRAPSSSSYSIAQPSLTLGAQGVSVQREMVSGLGAAAPSTRAELTPSACACPWRAARAGEKPALRAHPNKSAAAACWCF